MKGNTPLIIGMVTLCGLLFTDTWEKEGKIASLRDFCKAQNEDIHEKYDEVKSYNAWNVAQSNPCFEIWLYYHFYENKPAGIEMEQCASFKEFVGHSISGGFNYERDPVRLDTAINDTEKNYSVDDEGKPMLYSSEMYVLGQEISGFVKGDISIKNRFVIILIIGERSQVFFRFSVSFRNCLFLNGYKNLTGRYVKIHHRLLRLTQIQP